MIASGLTAAAIFLAGLGLAQEVELLETGADSRFYMSDAAYSAAEGRTGVVLVPDLIFKKENLAPLAIELQALGIPSVVISATDENPIRRAIQELVRRDHRDVVLLGSGAGAEAILNTMQQVVSTDVVSGVILVAPTGGSPLADRRVDKLIVVSEGDAVRGIAQALHEASAEPKGLLILQSEAEGHFLLMDAEEARLRSALSAFIRAR